MADRTLSYQEAIQEGLAFNPKSGSDRNKYYDILGGGDRAIGKQVYQGKQFKSEDFWKTSFTQFQNVAGLTSLNRAQTLLSQAKEKTMRTTGAQKATSARAMRATGGLLSGSQAPDAGNLSTGPMLGGDSMLSEATSLGKRTRL